MKLIKILFKTIIIFITILLIYIGYIFIKPLIFSGNNLASVNYKNLNSELTEINFQNKNIYIFLFDPECNSCNKIQEKIKEISKNNSNNIYFITECTDKESIRNYIRKNKLENYSSHFLIDYEFETSNNFNLGPMKEYPILITINNEEKSVESF